MVFNPLHGAGGGAADGGDAAQKSFSFSFGGQKSTASSTTAEIGNKLSTAATQVASGQVPTFTEESAFHKCCPNLTYKQRLYGFVGTCAFGWVLSFVGSFILIGGPTSRNIAAFAVLFVCGNIMALIGTGFLLGPKTQCKRMWDPTRRFSAAFYLTMLIVVFAVAVSGQNVGIVLLMLIIEICAATWYGLSYVPFGRKIVIEFAKRTCKCGGGAK